MKRDTLHYDNLHFHRSKKVVEYNPFSDIRAIKHQIYSYDITSSDFGLFGTVKKRIEGEIKQSFFL